MYSYYHLLFPAKAINIGKELPIKEGMSLCSCGCDTFLTGGNSLFGITTVQCMECNTEFLISKPKVVFKIHTHKPPLTCFIPKKFKSKYLYLRDTDEFMTGSVARINDIDYYFTVERMGNVFGEIKCNVIDNKMVFVSDSY